MRLPPTFLVVIAAGGLVTPSLCGGIRYDAEAGRWHLTSGSVEYRLRQEGNAVYLEYFGPAGGTAWPLNPGHAWAPGTMGYSDIGGRLEDEVLRPQSLRLSRHTTTAGRPGVEVLHLFFEHRRLPADVRVDLTAWADTAVFTRVIAVTNKGPTALRIGALPSGCWRLPAGDYVLSTLWGGWGHERQLSTERLESSPRAFVSRQGRSTHGYSPWFCLSNESLRLRILGQLAWSGNWEMHFRRAPGPRELRAEDLEVELGLRFDEGGSLWLPPGGTFETPAIAFTASTGDLDDAANALKRYQHRFVAPTTPANDPMLVQFNSWYPFPGKMTVADMKRCASLAAELGVEVFVLDAGWYSQQDWSRELGDWTPDPAAFPNGLEEIAQYLDELGLKFGLWLELENAGVDSQVRLEHPDWFLSRQGQPITGHQRCPLNFALPEVRQWARAVVDRLVQACGLDWIKLDYNIDVGDRFDPVPGVPVGAVLGHHLTAYYAWLDEIRAAYPALVLENCSSGGLRFDLGMAAHTHTTWLSDEVLPLPSLQLAYGSTLEFAPRLCNHWMVGDRYDGTVRSDSPPAWWDFLFRVPMNGQFGLSSRVFDWPEALRQRARENIALYKGIRDVLRDADVYHLTPPPARDNPTNWMGLQYVAPGRDRSVLMAYRLADSPSLARFRLRGLDPEANYQVKTDDANGGILRGQQLAREGLTIALEEEWQAAVIELERTTERKVIRLEGNQTDRVFEGIGALSAGASSRLLIDYPEPYRSQILDFLFKPNYGAAFQHLKVEVGGDVNSTDGCEPSHMHTRDDLDFERGYEWWLMKEARRRNPAIYLDCLEWGAPAWVGNGHFYSQDNADYLVAFLRGAREVHGLDLQYVGVWNETRYDTGWIKLFRQTLDAHGFSQVTLVAADEINQWTIVDLMAGDPALAAAVGVVGSHYPKYQCPPAVQDCGKPVWCSEDGPWKGDWEGAQKLVKMYNRNYVEGRMTKTIIWSPVTAYYDNLPLPSSGTMRANTPWSGYYELQPALWATAHTTQFAQPGWVYLGNQGCGVLPGGGSYVTLRSPGGEDYSVILETVDQTAPQDVAFELGPGLSASRVHVWHSNADRQFVQLEDIQPGNGRWETTLEGGSIYSFTTTTGQNHGTAACPPPAAFPLPYHEDFESYRPGAMAKYLSDQAGVFEVVRRADGQGQALRQVVPAKGIEWHFHLNPFPETFLGDLGWRDYRLCVEALIEKEGFVSLFGRVRAVPQNAGLPTAYWLKVAHTGHWELGQHLHPLASGTVPFGADRWHTLELQFRGPIIRVVIDGASVRTIFDNGITAGMAGVGSGYHGAQFDNLSIRPL